MLKINLLALLLAFSTGIFAQSFPYDIVLKPVSITGLSGLQSYSFGQSNGKWLLVGGRLDGLHQRQPFAAFSLPGHNSHLIVVDPVTKQQWTASLSSLPAALQEQLQSTNAVFIQEGDYLYIIGGYGYSAAVADHKTFENLTAISLPDLINAIVNNNPITSYFQQISDVRFAVTGGRIGKIYDTYYLVGGQKFDGRYNPMGNPTFTQTYSEQIRKFTITNDGTNLVINHLPYLTDAANLHRRDYNMAPQILPNGQEGLTAFSGVFQPTADLPFLNCVNIDSANYAVNNAFAQYYNHYECPVLPVYDASNNVMTTVFFGGIAQYYDVNGVLTMDSQVPFVNTIARVSRDANGQMAEYKLPVEMPALLGAGAHFIHDPNLDYYANGVLKLDNLTDDSTHLGYIYGGISSSAPNIFFTNTGTQSAASTQLFEVVLVKNTAASIHQLNEQSEGSLQWQVYPNPNDGIFKMDFTLIESSKVSYSIMDLSGKIISQESNYFTQGKHTVSITMEAQNASGIYLMSLEVGGNQFTQKVILK